MTNLMNVNANNQPTMSSLEIAELTGKQHGHIIRDIKGMIEKLYSLNPNLDSIDLQGIFVEKREDNGQTKAIHLDRYHTEVLVTGYDVNRRAAVIKRWYDLETGKATPAAFSIPQTYVEALRLAADQAEQIEKQTLLLEQQKPMVEVYDKLANTKGDVITTVLAKHLETSAKALNEWLRDKGIKWQNRDIPKAGYEDWFNVVTRVNGDMKYQQCLITPKGQVEIAKRWNKHS